MASLLVGGLLRLTILHVHAKSKRRTDDMVNMGVEPRTLALLAPRSKPTELIDRDYHVIPEYMFARYDQVAMVDNSASAYKAKPEAQDLLETMFSL